MTDFSGQWIGEFSGTNRGLAMLDLDLEDGFLEGMIYAFDQDPSIPSSCAPVTLKPSNGKIEFEVRPEAICQSEPRFLASHEIEADFPKILSVSLKLEDLKLQGTWSTDIETSGEVTLFKSRAGDKSALKPEGGTISWVEFQNLVSKFTVDPYRNVFRGQSSTWRLRTSFHRSKRKDIWRYWNEDIPRIRHASVGVVDQLFDPNIAEHNGAFMHLLQHHGFPTPMLDWTYSPYIAAFFGYSSAQTLQDIDNPIRIFMFDAEQWKLDYPQILNITLCRPHFSLIEPLALGNPRALPQKSMATVTNVDDIEGYIATLEDRSKHTYLRAFDLDPTERNEALRQLGLMGISPGSMFPGIEGICREFKDRQFGY